MCKRALSIFVFIWGFSFALFSQQDPFNIELEAFSIPELGGVQSYSIGQHKGKWLIVGGRLDGLHRRQPWAAFDEDGHNNQLIVVDPESLEKWSAPLTTLPVSIQEQLSSTNMNFYQDGDHLFITGGYGFSETYDDHYTFPYLTIIDVPSTINAIINNKELTSHFRQVVGDNFQVTGGKLAKIDDTFYLLGGHKFIGRYNPMGPDHGPGFEQEYTNAVRKFKVTENGTSIDIEEFPELIDSLLFHKRDYNAVPQILLGGEQGITMFSGVFQYDEDVPFLNAVNVSSTDFAEVENFNQYYNHYHCPNIPLYSESSKEMHTVFFGGISQFYDSLGILVQDKDVPFVKTIARVSRQSNGQMEEFKLPVEMPNLLGAGAEFIPIEELPKYENEVIKLDNLPEEKTLVGYIFGGIKSSASNIFWINDGTQSSATSQIFKVYLSKNKLASSHQLNELSSNNFDFELYPNPAVEDKFSVKLELLQAEQIRLSIINESGQFLGNVLLNGKKGENTFSIEAEAIKNKGTFFITIRSKYYNRTKVLFIK